MNRGVDRGTGRTTNMLKEAVRLTNTNQIVFVVIKNHRDFDDTIRLLMKIAPDARAIFIGRAASFPNGSRIRFIVSDSDLLNPNFSGKQCSVRGYPLETQILFDHRVLESLWSWK